MGRGGGASPQAKSGGRMFWPREAANGERGAAPSAGAGPARESVRVNLKSVFTRWPSSLSAPFLSLMVVQTLRMKIQESPVTCDTGRVGGGDVRGSDPDCEKTSCEDVPRLDLTALTEDSSWGGEGGGVLLLFSCFACCVVACRQTRQGPWTHAQATHPALRTGAWGAAAHLLPPPSPPPGAAPPASCGISS